jgi:hypothetical protein
LLQIGDCLSGGEQQPIGIHFLVSVHDSRGAIDIPNASHRIRNSAYQTPRSQVPYAFPIPEITPPGGKYLHKEKVSTIETSREQICGKKPDF